MTDQREQDIIDSFVAFADRLIDDDIDVLDLTTQLAWDCARLLDVAAVGLLLADAGGVLHLLAATSEDARKLEEREHSWRAEPDRWAKAFSLAFAQALHDPTLKLLHRCYEQAGNPSTPPPPTWRSDLLHPAERHRLGLE